MEKYHEYKGFTLEKKLAQVEVNNNQRKVKRRARASMFALAALLPSAGAGIIAARQTDTGVAVLVAGQHTSEQKTTSISPATTVFLRRENDTTSTIRSKLKGRTAPTPSPAPQTSSTNTGESWSGKASYYSRNGCVGCRPDRLMANGEPLNDNALTVAFNRLPIGTFINIKNLESGLSAVAEVTDTGGFEKLKEPKIVDLTPATRDAIGCSVPCTVHITRA